MVMQRSIHLFLFCLPCFEVLFCQFTEEDLQSDRIPTQRPALISEGSNFFEEYFTRRPKEVPPQGGSRYLNKNRKKPNIGNTEYLYGLLGDDFRPDFMSTKKPKRPLKPVPLTEVSLNISEEIMTQKYTQFEDFNFTKELASLQSDLLPYENEIKSWLRKRSSCPVNFTWKNLGPTYWPQWVRYGDCVDRKGECSFPNGMKCTPDGVLNLQTLRWKCTKRIRKKGRFFIYKIGEKESKSDHSSKKNRERCNWEKVPLPVTVACHCSC